MRMKTRRDILTVAPLRELGRVMLYGLDRNGQQIVDQADFFLQEWLGVGHATEHSVEARHGFNPRVDFVVGREEIFACLLIAELGFVSENGGELSLKLLADVDHKRRPYVVIQRSVNDLERAMRWKERSAGILPAVLRASRPQLAGDLNVIRGGPADT